MYQPQPSIEIGKCQPKDNYKFAKKNIQGCQNDL